jgi:hypothetical protein
MSIEALFVLLYTVRPLFTVAIGASAVWVFVIGILMATEASNWSGYTKLEEKAPTLKVFYSRLKKSLSALVISILATSASFVPEYRLDARIQLLKLEITSPEVRKEVYENIERVFKKLEDKYLGEESQKKEEEKK